MKSAIIALILSSLLTGCFGAHSDAAQRLTAGDVVIYSRGMQKAIVAEVRGGQCPMLTEVAKDFSVLRDQVRLKKATL